MFLWSSLAIFIPPRTFCTSVVSGFRLIWNLPGLAAIFSDFADLVSKLPFPESFQSPGWHLYVTLVLAIFVTAKALFMVVTRVTRNLFLGPLLFSLLAMATYSPQQPAHSIVLVLAVWRLIEAVTGFFACSRIPRSANEPEEDSDSE
eukprot:TRINITY_DN6149_c0_g1_i1.p2 TRINITY_DN6149_c0_g1~~TRINITY_DN6149_c0_g1_i1.p2  ORF type:complete len:147 (+),score=24.21 TRINITY_DN6149_c0_g1_i1:419-859(+)